MNDQPHDERRDDMSDLIDVLCAISADLKRIADVAEKIVGIGGDDEERHYIRTVDMG